MKRVVISDGEPTEVQLVRTGDTVVVSMGERQESFQILKTTADEIQFLSNGVMFRVPYFRSGETLEFLWNGEHQTEEVSSGAPKRSRSGREHSLAAPMPGVVLKIFVSPGAVVTKGMPLLVLEAMKMEHQIVAPYDGTITSIACKEGELVQPGVDLIVVAPEEKK